MPGHFLLTETVLTTMLAWIMPSKRPMDNVAAGWHRPQEDPVSTWEQHLRIDEWLSNTMPAEPTALDLETLTADEIDRWKSTLHRFIKRTCYSR